MKYEFYVVYQEIGVLGHGNNEADAIEMSNALIDKYDKAYPLSIEKMGRFPEPFANHQIAILTGDEAVSLKYVEETKIPKEILANPSFQRMIGSGIFDRDFYTSCYLDIPRGNGESEMHYFFHGGREGRWPSHLFRGDWYMERYPDAKASGMNPLLHFLEIGAPLGYQPMPLFDTQYYLEKYGSVIGDINPLAHYLAAKGDQFNPSARFNNKRYAETYSPRMNCLKHYLAEGMQLGYVPERAEPPSAKEVVENASIRYLKRNAVQSRVALFITHTPSGTLKPHVKWYASSLAANGFSVFLIVASDSGEATVEPDLAEVCTNIVIRENTGFDFAAWAHVLKIRSDIYDCEEILLTNDSIFGPLSNNLGKVLSEIKTLPQDVVGLTSNFECARHLQSYFLLLRRKAIQSKAFLTFWNGVINIDDKYIVIREYETTMTARMEAAGLTTVAVFERALADRNDLIFGWEPLVQKGFPFIKMEVIKNANEDTKRRLSTVISAHGLLPGTVGL